MFAGNDARPVHGQRYIDDYERGEIVAPSSPT
jgi:hypothetical protein